jgi:hypothetical protein
MASVQQLSELEESRPSSLLSPNEEWIRNREPGLGAKMREKDLLEVWIKPSLTISMDQFV